MCLGDFSYGVQKGTELRWKMSFPSQALHFYKKPMNYLHKADKPQNLVTSEEVKGLVTAAFKLTAMGTYPPWGISPQPPLLFYDSEAKYKDKMSIIT